MMNPWKQSNICAILNVTFSVWQSLLEEGGSESGFMHSTLLADDLPFCNRIML